MGKWQGRYEINTLGRSLKVSAGTGGGSDQLVTNPSATALKRFLVYTDAEVHLRQGDSGVSASTNDLPLAKGAYRVITVSSSKDNYLAYITASGSANLYVQELTSVDPGTGSSGSNANPFDG